MATKFTFSKQMKQHVKCPYNYKIYVPSIDDADAFLIKYQTPYHDNFQWKTILIDAGYESSADKIINKLKYWKIDKIDYAFCTHPHKDHMGGFFKIFNSKDVHIKQFYILDPVCGLDNTINQLTKLGHAKTDEQIELRKTYDNANGENLIELAISKCKVYHLPNGSIIDGIDIQVVGPTKEILQEALNEINNNGWEDTTEAINEELKCFDDQPEINYIDAVKELDDIADDQDSMNKCSMMLLFSPKGDDRKYLFLGDATQKSIKASITANTLPTGCCIKVPHHGCAKNMDSNIIDKLRPAQSYISAKGYDTHPSKCLVVSLAKYGNVYSTQKGDFIISDKDHRLKSGDPNAFPPIMKKIRHN